MDAKGIPLPEGYSKQTGGAWRKGYAACVNGEAKETCPYAIGKARFGILYKYAWLAGWEKAKDESNNSR